MLRLMKAFLNWISRLYPLLDLGHDLPENVTRWVAPKCTMPRTTQQIFPLFQQWGVGRGMSFRKDTVSGDIFLQFCFFPFLQRHFLAQHSRWDVRPWSSVSCLTSNKGCNRMQLAGSVSTPKKDNAHSQHCPAFFSHGAYEEKLFNSQDINFI